MIVTSDNGPRIGRNGYKSAGPYRGYKSHIWEGGHREPFIARWPGKIKPGTTCDQLICLSDLIATCAAIVHHSVFGVFSVRQGQWKLILDTKTSGGWVKPRGRGPVPGTPGQLYSMADDPYETSDLWQQRPEIVKRLTKLLDKYKKEGRSRP